MRNRNKKFKTNISKPNNRNGVRNSSSIETNQKLHKFRILNNKIDNWGKSKNECQPSVMIRFEQHQV